MKPAILEKLDRLAERLTEIDGLLGRPEVAHDMDAYRKLTREHAEITPVVTLFHAYVQAEKDYAHAAELLADPEMKELAQAEQASAQASMAQLDIDLQTALLPKDPSDDKNLSRHRCCLWLAANQTDGQQHCYSIQARLHAARIVGFNRLARLADGLTTNL